MSIKYRTACGAAYIEAVEVEKETAQSVWIRGWTFKGPATSPARKHAKRSNYENYFDTWPDAKAFLLADAEKEVTEARLALQGAQGRLGNVKGLKPPKQTEAA